MSLVDSHLVIHQVLDASPDQTGAHVRESGDLCDVIEAVNVGQYLGCGQVPLLAPRAVVTGLSSHEDGDVMRVDMGRVMARRGDAQLEAVLATLNHAAGLGV